jgi:gluconolactonase
MTTTRHILFSVFLIFAVAAAGGQDWNFVVWINQGLSDIVPEGARVEKVAGSVGFLEGPVWVREGGYLFSSDIPANVIYKFNPSETYRGQCVQKFIYMGLGPVTKEDQGVL